jgi:hypothetical protein
MDFLRELAAAIVRNGCCQRLTTKEARRLQLAEQNKINRWRRLPNRRALCQFNLNGKFTSGWHFF